LDAAPLNDPRKTVSATAESRNRPDREADRLRSPAKGRESIETPGQAPHAWEELIAGVVGDVVLIRTMDKAGKPLDVGSGFEPRSETSKKERLAGGSTVALEEKVQEVLTELRRACDEYVADLARVKTGKLSRGDAESIFRRNPANRFARNFLQIGKSNPKTKVAFQAYMALCFVLLSGSDLKTTGDSLRQATDALVRDHFEEKELGQLALFMRTTPHRVTKRFLQSLVKRSPHREVSAYACWSLANILKRQVEEKPDSSAVAALQEEFASRLEQITDEFSDVTVNERPLSELVKPLLVKVDLSGQADPFVGKQAPEITGTDSSGQTFRLSDYRGNVVLVEFWGNWCGYCVRLFPDERNLVNRFQSRRFAMLGVNTDDSRDALISVEREMKVTWRSWYDGPSHGNGPITSQWNVRGFPTMCILDHKGIVRFKGTFDPEFLEQAIESLLDEAEHPSSDKKRRHKHIAPRQSDDQDSGS
jgi:peroxiredoxin